jgi:hypothetical protein
MSILAGVMAVARPWAEVESEEQKVMIAITYTSPLKD